MAFVTFDQLTRDQPIVDSLERLAKSASAETRPDVFLSHSQRDETHVARVAALLKRYGASVYADVLDRNLDVLSMKDKCERIRSAVRASRKLVVLFSQNTASSRWIPWELGLADGVGDVSSIATFPVAQTASEEEWGKQEYFALYPQVRWEHLQGQPGPTYTVLDPSSGRYWTLKHWLELRRYIRG